MILAFRHLWPAVMNRRKTVTRRRWSRRTFETWCRAWDEGRLIHDGWTNTPRVKGAKRFGTIRLTARPYLEALRDMPHEDLEAEGLGPDVIVPQGMAGFWSWFGGSIDDPVVVVRFEFVGLAFDFRADLQE